MTRMRPPNVARMVGEIMPASGNLGAGVEVDPGGGGGDVGVGVEVGEGQVQSDSAGQLGLTQRLVPETSWQSRLEGQSLSEEQVSQHSGIGVGVGVGLGVGVGVPVGGAPILKVRVQAGSASWALIIGAKAKEKRLRKAVRPTVTRRRLITIF